MADRPDVEAIERKMPKIFEVDNKIKVTSDKLSEIKNWITGEDYRLTDVRITQLASRELEDGTIESEFEVNSVKAA